MKAIQKWAFVAIALCCLAFSTNASAQKLFTKEEMTGIQTTNLHKLAVIHYLKKHVGINNVGENFGKGIESTESRLAFTLFKSLSAAQMKEVKAALLPMTGNGSVKGAGESFVAEDAPQLVKCSILYYDDMWYWLDLCTK